MSNLRLLYRLVVTDRNGRVVKKTRWRKSRSFVVGFLKQLYALMNHAYEAHSPEVSIVDVDGVSQTIECGSYYESRWFGVNAPDDDDTYGIQVGTGTTPPSNTDYALEAKITHGTGAGQLDYGAHSFSLVVGDTVDIVISRTFYNGSGGDVTVREIGIVTTTITTTAGQRYFLIVRDVLASPVVVANTRTLTVQYTIRTTA